jgi:hypothetical protein
MTSGRCSGCFAITVLREQDGLWRVVDYFVR